MVLVTLKSDPRDPAYYSLSELHEVNGENYPNRLRRWAHSWRPPTDVYETEQAVVVRVEIAGMRDSDFTITLDGKILSIRGMRSDVPERRAYHQMEIRFGEFGTEVELPHAVVADAIEAYYNNGILRIVMPKAAPRKVPVEG